MSKHIFLIIVTLLYVAQSWAYIYQKNYGIALTIGAYAVANVGLIWSML